MKNHEIATHTLHHVADPGATAYLWGASLSITAAQPGSCLNIAARCPAPADLFQIVGMKLWLNQTAHVPLEKIRVSGRMATVLLGVLMA